VVKLQRKNVEPVPLLEQNQIRKLARENPNEDVRTI
jgi:hypothetical protein